MDETTKERPALSWLLALLSLCALAIPLALAAQSKPVVGVVTERDTGAPLPGVYVALVADEDNRPQAAALTDESGRFVLRGELGGTYRLRAERVGLLSVTTDPFVLTADTGIQRVGLVEQAIELAAVTVQVPVGLCEINPTEALIVQRWWDEIRKALQSAAFVHANDLDRFRFERFQREWTRDLSGLRAERYFAADGASARPFLAQDAETLSRMGYVQGEPGERRFFAPDAAVLFSESFLRDHCFGLASGERDGTKMRLSVEALASREVTDIEGFIEIDTLTSELSSFDFEYVGLPDDIPSRADAGGHLTFEYLPSGAWIVSEWWVRMPRVDPRIWPPTVLSYLDEGGRVTGVTANGEPVDAGVGDATLHGVVYDSLAGRPLEGARVSIVGSRISTETGQDGTFDLVGVPAGQRGVTVHHADLARLGIPSPVLSVSLAEGAVDSIRVTIPSFRVIAELLCGTPTETPLSILTGAVLERVTGTPVASTEVRARWLRPPSDDGQAASMYSEGTTGSDGRYILCGLPPDLAVTLGVRVGSGWRDAGTATLPERTIVAKDLRPTARALDAVVRGYVSDASTGSSLSSTTVTVLDSSGASVASVSADVSGQFRIVVPRVRRFQGYSVERWLRAAIFGDAVDRGRGRSRSALRHDRDIDAAAHGWQGTRLGERTTDPLGRSLSLGRGATGDRARGDRLRRSLPAHDSRLGSVCAGGAEPGILREGVAAAEHVRT